MTPSEQQLYVDALDMAMTRGHHILFTEIHSEMTSATEFYRTCGFLYWNRRFLLAYENMLRSLNPRFACVTIPYWDYFADYARFLDGKCTSIQSCAPILTGLGGSSGAPKKVKINGKDITANCVSQSPLGSFCESSTITSPAACARCLPRSDWTAKPFPSGFGYAGLGVTLGRANGLREVSNNLQLGIHNSIHNVLSSTMATYMSSADPVFFSHHATIDMLHQIYLECQLGRNVTNAIASTSRFGFQKCSFSNEVCPNVTSNVTQLWKVAVPPIAANLPLQARAHPSLRSFFGDIPEQYSQYMTINDLGVFSYDYQKDDLMKNLQANGFVCPRLQQNMPGTPTPTTGAPTFGTVGPPALSSGSRLFMAQTPTSAPSPETTADVASTNVPSAQPVSTPLITPPTLDPNSTPTATPEPTPEQQSTIAPTPSPPEPTSILSPTSEPTSTTPPAVSTPSSTIESMPTSSPTSEPTSGTSSTPEPTSIVVPTTNRPTSAPTTSRLTPVPTTIQPTPTPAQTTSRPTPSAPTPTTRRPRRTRSPPTTRPTSTAVNTTAPSSPTTTRPPARALQSFGMSPSGFRPGGVIGVPIAPRTMPPTPAPAPMTEITSTPPTAPRAATSSPPPSSFSGSFGTVSGGTSWERLQQERGFQQQLTINFLKTSLQAALTVDGTMQTAFEQVELMECLFHDESLGGVEDYSDFFRANYGLDASAHPRCYTLVEQLRTGVTQIRVQNWRALFQSYFVVTSVTNRSMSTTT